MPMRTRIRPWANASCASRAAPNAPGAVGKAMKKASPCVSTSAPPCRAQAALTTRRCSARASAYASDPSSWRSLVEPSTSVKRNVTVPVGRSFRATSEHGSSREAALGVGLITRPRERLRCLTEHRTGLLGLALGLAEDPPGLPDGAGPQPALPHTRDALRLGEERARPIQVADTRGGRGRARQIAHGTRFARVHLAQLLLGPAQNGDGVLWIRGCLDHRAKHSDQQVGDDVGAPGERLRSAEQSIGVVLAAATDRRLRDTLPRQR